MGRQKEVALDALLRWPSRDGLELSQSVDVGLRTGLKFIENILSGREGWPLRGTAK